MMDPNLLFFAGILSIPPFLLIESIWLKLGLLLFYYCLSLFNKKHIRITYFLILSFFIVFFELMIPAGKILLEIGPVRLTDMALRRGVFKAATLVGLVFISLSTIRKDIRIPGGAGILFGKTFYYFEQLLQSKNRVKGKRFIESIDRILFSIYPLRFNNENPNEQASMPESGGTEKNKQTQDDKEIKNSDKRTKIQEKSGMLSIKTSVLIGFGLAAVPWVCLIVNRLYLS
jgi:hypothetical protein